MTDQIAVFLVAMIFTFGIPIAFWLLGSPSADRRRESLARLASRNRFSFHPALDPNDIDFFQRITTLKFFAARRWGDSTNFLTRTEKFGETLVYDFQVGSEDLSGPGMRSTFAAFRVSGAHFPEFVVWPRSDVGPIHRWIDAGYALDDLQIDPSLNERYHVRGRDPAAVRSMLGPEIQKWLMRKHGWMIETDREWVVFHRMPRNGGVTDYQVASRELPGFLRACGKALNLLATAAGVPLDG